MLYIITPFVGQKLRTHNIHSLIQIQFVNHYSFIWGFGGEVMHKKVVKTKQPWWDYDALYFCVIYSSQSLVSGTSNTVTSCSMFSGSDSMRQLCLQYKQFRYKQENTIHAVAAFYFCDFRHKTEAHAGVSHGFIFPSLSYSTYHFLQRDTEMGPWVHLHMSGAWEQSRSPAGIPHKHRQHMQAALTAAPVLSFKLSPQKYSLRYIM